MSHTKRISTTEVDNYQTIENWNDYLASSEDIKTKSEFHRKIFESQVVITGTWDKAIRFTDCYFKNGIHINGSLYDGFVFERCGMDNVCDFYNQAIVAGLCRFYKCNIDHLCFVGAKIDYLDIEVCEIADLQIFSSEFKGLRITGDANTPTLSKIA